MISKIFARGFKGGVWDQEIGRYTLFVGKNGAGKSARAQALTLAVLGYLPQDQAKQAGAIYATHATAPEMIVAFETEDGSRFARKYRKSEDGSVSQVVSLNGKPVNQKQIERTLIDLGNPLIFDLRAFNELSEQKQIDYLLSLSPPSPELKTVTAGIVTQDEKITFKRSELRSKKMVIEQLTQERAGLQLPSGTLAEIQAEIKAKEGEKDQAEADLKQAEKEEAERAAKVKADEEAKNKLEEFHREMKAAQNREAEALKTAATAQTELKQMIDHSREQGQKFNELMSEVAEHPEEFVFPPDYQQLCRESLTLIKDTLVSAGCGDACAALIILNAELAKYQEEEGVLV